MKMLPYLSFIAITSILFLLLYFCIKEICRARSHDPQAEVIYALREQLQRGRTAADWFRDPVRLDKYPEVFVAVFDAEGKALRTTGSVDGSLHRLPKAVREQARKKGEHWLTWQPENKIRMAVGIVHVPRSPVAFIAAGRPVQELENSEASMRNMILGGWTLCLGIIFLNALVHFSLLKFNNTI